MLRPLLAEFTGTALLLATVVGSGIMGEHLAGGNAAIALLANAVATGAILFVLIHVFGPLSGAHFNPLVSLAMGLNGGLPSSRVAPYILVQLAGAILGVVLAHAMFDLAWVQVSQSVRSSPGQWLSEGVATFGLLLTILGLHGRKPEIVPTAVALFIVGAYWFTASTSFANPAVTLARSLTDTFSGIAPVSTPGFMIAQCVGAASAISVSAVLFKVEKR